MTTPAASPSEPLTIVENGTREAIIFIPAIGRAWDDPQIEGVARRMAIAIDRNSKTEKATTRVEIAQQEYGAGYKCKMFSILKKEGQAEKPLIDVFGLDYNDTLVESYSTSSLLMKTLLLAITLVDSFWRLIFRFYKRSKGWKEKLQLAYGLMISALLIAYLVVLIVAVVASFERLKVSLQNATSPQSSKSVPQPPQSAPVVQQSEPVVTAGIWSSIKSLSGRAWKGSKRIYEERKEDFLAVIALMTALGFVLPPTAKIKENISLAATNYLCLIHYLNWGERSHAISGKLESLLEHLVQREQVYSKIHIVAYSFGSIVAIDNLFTTGRKPIDRFKRIDTLVTIGCPFDMIRTYWPNYFMGRQSVTPVTPTWINVYSPKDVLSSNFADGGNDSAVQGIGTVGIGVEVDGQIRTPQNIRFSQGTSTSLGLIDILTLTGFKAHSQYWGEEVKGEVTCFHNIVKKMYEGTSVLD